MDLAGVGEELRSMTATEFDGWVRGTEPVTAGRAPALLLRWEVEQIRALVRELTDWQTADQARRRNELVDTRTHRRSPVTDLDRLSQQQREQRIDRLCNDLAEQVDLTWVQ